MNQVDSGPETLGLALLVPINLMGVEGVPGGFRKADGPTIDHSGL